MRHEQTLWLIDRYQEEEFSCLRVLRYFSTTFETKLTWVRQCFCYDIFQLHKLCIFIPYYLIKNWRRFPDFVVSFALISCYFSLTAATLRSRQEKSSFDQCYLKRHDVHKERLESTIFQSSCTIIIIYFYTPTENYRIKRNEDVLLNTDTSLLRTVCFVPDGERKSLHFL